MEKQFSIPLPTTNQQPAFEFLATYSHKEEIPPFPLSLYVSISLHFPITYSYLFLPSLFAFSLSPFL